MTSSIVAPAAVMTPDGKYIIPANAFSLPLQDIVEGKGGNDDQQKRRKIDFLTCHQGWWPAIDDDANLATFNAAATDEVSRRLGVLLTARKRLIKAGKDELFETILDGFVTAGWCDGSVLNKTNKLDTIIRVIDSVLTKVVKEDRYDVVNKLYKHIFLIAKRSYWKTEAIKKLITNHYPRMAPLDPTDLVSLNGSNKQHSFMNVISGSPVKLLQDTIKKFCSMNWKFYISIRNSGKEPAAIQEVEDYELPKEILPNSRTKSSIQIRYLEKMTGNQHTVAYKNSLEVLVKSASELDMSFEQVINDLNAAMNNGRPMTITKADAVVPGAVITTTPAAPARTSSLMEPMAALDADVPKLPSLNETSDIVQFGDVQIGQSMTSPTMTAISKVAVRTNIPMTTSTAATTVTATPSPTAAPTTTAVPVPVAGQPTVQLTDNERDVSDIVVSTTEETEAESADDTYDFPSALSASTASEREGVAEMDEIVQGGEETQVVSCNFLSSLSTATAAANSNDVAAASGEKNHDNMKEIYVTKPNAPWVCREFALNSEHICVQALCFGLDGCYNRQFEKNVGVEMQPGTIRKIGGRVRVAKRNPYEARARALEPRKEKVCQHNVKTGYVMVNDLRFMFGSHLETATKNGGHLPTHCSGCGGKFIKGMKAAGKRKRK